jgi:hypothetical protein
MKGASEKVARLSLPHSAQLKWGVNEKVQLKNVARLSLPHNTRLKLGVNEKAQMKLMLQSTWRSKRGLV